MPFVLFLVFGFLAVVAALVGSFLVGAVWGALLRLGFVGRILTTLITALPLFFIAAPIISGGGIVLGDAEGTMSLIIVVLSILLPVWYFFWHYHAIENMGVATFSVTSSVPIIMYFAGVALGSLVSFFFSPDLERTAFKICFAVCLIAGIIYYFIKTRQYSNTDPKETAVRWIAVLVAVCIAVACSVMLINRGAKAETARKDAKAAAVAQIAANNMSGQTLSLTTTANLRAEPSGTGKVIKKLHYGDTITATGERNSLWIPIESGNSKGYVFAPFMKFNEVYLVDHPFDAIIQTSVQLTNFGGTKGPVIPKGTVITFVNSFDEDDVELEYKNGGYRVTKDVAETFAPKLNEDGSIAVAPKDISAGFKKNKKATVTEDIVARNFYDGKETISLPKGATVTIVELYKTGSRVSYNGKDATVQLKYLAPAD
jgi:hypothetical protein